MIPELEGYGYLFTPTLPDLTRGPEERCELSHHSLGEPQLLNNVVIHQLKIMNSGATVQIVYQLLVNHPDP